MHVGRSSMGESVAACGASVRPIVIYDDACGWCVGSVRRVQAADWFGRLEVLGYTDAVARYPEVGRGALGDGLRVRFADGSVTIGIDAIRSILMRTPLGMLPGLALWVPGVHWMGARIYGVIARRRPTACELPTPRGTADR